MILILAQRGATSWGFQFGGLWFYVNFPGYWRLSGQLGSHGYDRDAKAAGR